MQYILSSLVKHYRHLHLFILLFFKCQGLDMGRRLCIYGFCRSVEMLSDVVEDTVLEYGGEVCVLKPLSFS